MKLTYGEVRRPGKQSLTRTAWESALIENERLVAPLPARTVRSTSGELLDIVDRYARDISVGGKHVVFFSWASETNRNPPAVVVRYLHGYVQLAASCADELARSLHGSVVRVSQRFYDLELQLLGISDCVVEIESECERFLAAFEYTSREYIYYMLVDQDSLSFVEGMRSIHSDRVRAIHKTELRVTEDERIIK